MYWATKEAVEIATEKATARAMAGKEGGREEIGGREGEGESITAKRPLVIDAIGEDEGGGSSTRKRSRSGPWTPLSDEPPSTNTRGGASRRQASSKQQSSSKHKSNVGVGKGKTYQPQPDAGDSCEDEDVVGSTIDEENPDEQEVLVRWTSWIKDRRNREAREKEMDEMFAEMVDRLGEVVEEMEKVREENRVLGRKVGRLEKRMEMVAESFM